MSRSHAVKPHHEFIIEGTAPWPVLKGSDFQENPGERCCKECGRRLLLIFIESSNWVSHRTEHVSFRDDRTVVRDVTVEFYVPEEAPIFRGDDGTEYSLVPLSVMRRKTLVNFKLRDEEGKSVVLPSLRQNQAITESVLLACADATIEQPSDMAGPISQGHIANFIHTVVSGDQNDLLNAYDSIENCTAAPAVLKLTQHRSFRAILDRLADNFVLWVMIPAGAPRRRVLNFSNDEPLSLHYRKPDSKVDKYELGPKLKPLTRTVLGSALGLTTTRIRFPVPSAENTASFHFEIDAPRGVQIVEASLLAGRPNDERPSFDHVQGGFPTVGLHVIEVPNGSRSKVQIGLQVVNRGWLMTSMLSSWAVFGLLLAFALHQPAVRSGAEGVPPLVLIALAGAIAGLIAQSDAHALAAHLLRWARSLAAVAVVLPLVATTYIALEPERTSRISFALWGAAAVSGLIAMTLTTVCFLGWYRQHQSVSSPWEQNRKSPRVPSPPHDFDQGAVENNYHKPAIRVDSAEGWHTEFLWDSASEQQLIDALKRPSRLEHLRSNLHFAASGAAWARASRRPRSGSRTLPSGTSASGTSRAPGMTTILSTSAVDAGQSQPNGHTDLPRGRTLA